MTLLFNQDILNQIVAELKTAEEKVCIISAYCKFNALKELVSNVSENVSQKKLMVRFLLNDVLKGSSDIEALEYALSNNWEVFIKFDMHMKTYIFDNKRCISGSANLTNNGLNITNQGNCEQAILAEIDEQDIEKVNNLFNSSIKIDFDLLAKLKTEIEKNKHQIDIPNLTWSNEILDLFNPKIDSLFSYELPGSACFDDEGLAFLELSHKNSFDEIKSKFIKSKIYFWLVHILQENNNNLFFGSLSEKLHNILIADPKPYRKDVKFFLANIFSFIEKLKLDEFIIDIPERHSQRIRLIDKKELH